MISKIAFAALMSFFALSNRTEAGPGKNKIDSMSRVFLSKSSGSCVVIGVVDHDQVSYYAFGKTEKNGRHNADSLTFFEIGSITKVFTALSIANLANEGRLSYADPVSKYFPDSIRFPRYREKKISIETLLQHTSGLAGIPDNLLVPGVDSLNPYRAYTVQNLYQYLNKASPERAPAEKYEYSNLGFGIAGQAISNISGKTYQQYLKDNIFIPLSMNASTANSADTFQKIFAAPYSENGDRVKRWDFDAMAGAGAIRSNLVDMLKFLKFSMNPDINIQNSAKSLVKGMHDCQTMTIDGRHNLKVGLGWHISPLDGDQLIWHNGETGGYRSFLGFTKNHQQGIVVLTNSQSDPDNLAIMILHGLSY
jgi:CubicO group peptidase (beta-lactamase class C family)